MADNFFEIKGLRELESALLKLDAIEGAEQLRGDLMTASKLALDDMKIGVPVDEGDLRRAIGRRSRIGTGRGVTVAKVFVGIVRKVRVRDGAGGARSVNQAAIAQEYGTKNHPAQPYIRPAFKRNIRGIIDSIQRSTWARLRQVRAPAGTGRR